MRHRLTRLTLLGILFFLPAVPTASAETTTADVVVYGGTSGGVAAAIQSKRMGKSVVLIEPTRHVGGLSSGGLGFTDSGDKRAIGGISREFYQKVKAHYDNPAAWTHESREGYKGYRPADDAMWTFEPKVAEQIFRVMLKDNGIPLVEGEGLDRTPKGIEKAGPRIRSIRTLSGNVYVGSVFIDATYEGDLMALAGVSYTVGREANSKYGETLNGVQRARNTHNHRFLKNVDPFVTPGDPKSGLLFGIDKDLPPDGAGDHRLQAFCYRMCMSNAPTNRIPFPKPVDYDETKYELLFRNFEAGDLRFPMKPDLMPNGKTDTNNNCAVSTDFIGQNHRYPDADEAERAKIVAAHESYQKGLMWSLANHPRVPAKIRDEMAKWGLPKDEFVATGGWPHQIYVREARRLVGEYVVTEADCRRTRPTPDPVGMGSYNMDSHNCARYVTPEGFVQNEGDVQVGPGGPYQIAYGSLIPIAGECTNLLVPVCLSSSHIAYGSIRMEPVFLILGQSAATAAVQAIEQNCDVQKIDRAKLRQQLLKDKQVLELAAPKSKGLDPKTLGGIIVDDEQADRVGFEGKSSVQTPYVGEGYRHDGGSNAVRQTAKFVPTIETAGKYEVFVSYSAGNNRASNAPVTIIHAGGTATIRVDQRKPAPVAGTWKSLGTYEFAAGKAGSVTISNEGADGHVIVDAVRWVRK
jgi:FAD dependent oxidoreductase